MQDIKQILENTKTIAIIGLSPKEHRDSFRVGKYLQDNGYKIIPIYPREESILGQRVYKSILEVDIHIDMINIFLNQSLIDGIVEQINKRNKPNEVIWSQLGIVNDEAYAKLNNKNIILDKCIKIEHSKIFHNIDIKPPTCELKF